MSRRSIRAYAVIAGVLMAAFQLTRPWGDVAEDTAAMAEALASPLWIVSHLSGAASFVAFALLVDAIVRTEVASARPRAAALGRASGIVGAALVLPYYGAETFALHEIGRSAQAGVPVDVVTLSTDIRGNAAAVAIFGVGLLLIAVAGICLALMCQRAGLPGWGVWPIGVLAALALPQFALPPAGRMAYGTLFLLSAVVFAFSWARWNRARSALVI